MSGFNDDWRCPHYMMRDGKEPAYCPAGGCPLGQCARRGEKAAFEGDRIMAITASIASSAQEGREP